MSRALFAQVIKGKAESTESSLSTLLNGFLDFDAPRIPFWGMSLRKMPHPGALPPLTWIW